MNRTPSYASLMTQEQRLAWVGRYHALEERLEETHPCEYGHYFCSTYQGGPCLDEVLSYVEANAEGDTHAAY